MRQCSAHRVLQKFVDVMDFSQQRIVLNWSHIHQVHQLADARNDFLLWIRIVSLILGKNPIRYTYRTCGRDENEDQGITRSSHCGFVNLEWPNIQQRFRGCLNVCHRDACNRAPENLLISSKFNICWILFIFNRFYSHHLSISSW